MSLARLLGIPAIVLLSLSGAASAAPDGEYARMQNNAAIAQIACGRFGCRQLSSNCHIHSTWKGVDHVRCQRPGMALDADRHYRVTYITSRRP
jgi:hypothetical protein